MVEASSFVSAFGAAPEFLVGHNMAIHYEDTSPQNITGGTPSPAVPVRSPFQTDSVALRMLLRCSWGMRDATVAAGKTAVAYLMGVTW